MAPDVVQPMLLSGCTSLTTSIFISPEVMKHTRTLISSCNNFLHNSSHPSKACLHQRVVVVVVNHKNWEVVLEIMKELLLILIDSL
jgi:hypothetical protein